MENHILYDVIDTLSNTWCCIDEARNKLGSKMTKGEYMLFISGCFQSMYVHQDLMDELLWICKVSNEDASSIREHIRNTRNELVGHPINTLIVDGEGKKLISTAVWCWSDVEGKSGVQKVEYLYRVEGDGIKQKRKVLHLENILDQHKQYVEYCLDLVLTTFKEHLDRHINNKQVKVLGILTKEVVEVKDYKVAAKLIADEKVGNFQAWNKMHGYYSYDNLIKAIDKRDEAIRYAMFVDNYFDEVIEIFKGEGAYNLHYVEIVNALNGQKKVYEPYEGDFPEIRLVPASSEDAIERKRTVKQATHYYISKLSEQRYYSDIDTMRKILHNYPEMQLELNHMEKHWALEKEEYRTSGYINREVEMEYYSAFLYLKYLIQEHKDDEL